MQVGSPIFIIMKGISNTINKEFIINNVSQVSIFSRYFGIDENDINKCIEKGKLIKSPIRIDDNASVGFRYNNKGMLKMRDFGGYFWGDCFDAVALVLNSNGTKININSKEGFKYVLNNIAKEFGIDKGVNGNTNNLDNMIAKVKTTKKTITFTVRNWDANDKKYWISKYDNLFTFNYLSSNHVYPVEMYWIDSDSQPEPKYYYTRNDPCYAYYLGTDSNGLVNIRLYFPNRSDKDKPKFISNNNAFQGLLNVDRDYDYIVITKSYKDVLALRVVLDASLFKGILKVLVTAYPSENYMMTDDVFYWLFDKLKEKDVTSIINFLDFDRTGRRTSKHCKDIYGIPYVFLTNGELGLPNNNAKDITDFIEKYGKSDAITIINQFIINYGKGNIARESDYNDGYAPF